MQFQFYVINQQKGRKKRYTGNFCNESPLKEKIDFNR